ncbi:MAG: FtsX-like permease family protein [Desulfurococcales archaeon]|nr:FtsX-like permease family protein [Desulfurococcales archaeon]
MRLAKASLRVLYRRRLDTASLVIVVVLVVFIYGVLSLSVYNVKEHVYVQVRSELGDVAVASTFTEDVARRIAERAGAASYRLYLVAFAKMDVGGENVSVVLIGASHFDSAVKVKALDGSKPAGVGEAAYYKVISGGGFQVPDVGAGSIVKVYAYTYEGVLEELEFRITGVYRGFSWVGGLPYALVVNESVVELITGGSYYLAAFWTSSGNDKEIDALEERLLDVMDDEGLQVYWVFKNKKEENPIVNLLESAANILLVPTSVVLLLSALLPAAAGAIAVFRDLRVIATLRAIGVSWPGLFAYYSLPWILRGLAGSLVAVLMLLLWADDVYFALFVRDSEIASIMRDSLGFAYDYRVLAEASITALALVLLGSMVPLALSTRVDTVKVLRISEVPLEATPPRTMLRGPIALRAALRDLASRRWKLVGFAIALGVLWGMAVSMEMESLAIEGIKEFYEEEMPADAFISITSLAPIVPEPVWKTVGSDVGRDASIGSYAIFYSDVVINALEARGERVTIEFIYLLEGSPHTAFPLSKGRYPERPGEALTSEALAEYLGLQLGDRVRALTPSGDERYFTIVGVSKSRTNNGFYLVVADRDVFEEEPGYYDVTLYLDFLDGAGEGSLDSIEERIESHGYLSIVFSLTRSDIVDGIDILGSFLKAIFSGLVAVSSIAAGVVVSSMALVDASTRSREIAVLLALGASRRLVIASYLLQLLVALALAAPLALISGYVLAEATAARSALALGYLDPQLDPGAVATPLFTISLAITVAWLLAALLVFLRRLKVTEVLRE